MAQVKILLKGYTNEDQIADDGEEHTRPTMTLVQDQDINMVVDPGVMVDPQELVDALAKEGLAPNDVNFVCLTHSHIDHFRHLGLFPKAKVLEFYGIWEKDTVNDWDEQFTPDIRIVKTPGHNRDGLTLFVTTDEGIVAICGDVFWSEGKPIEDPYASDPEALKTSRQAILGQADWIIPGHAGKYQVKK